MRLDWRLPGRPASDRAADTARMRHALPQWHRIAVPAFGAPFSGRSVRAACRLAQMSDGKTDGCDVRLVYVIEVPRALSIATELPGEEALAEQFLEQARQRAYLSGSTAMTDVLRGREAVETLIRHVRQSEIDLLVLGSRTDEVRGLPISLTRQLLARAPCAVLLDHIGGENAEED